MSLTFKQFLVREGTVNHMQHMKAQRDALTQMNGDVLNLIDKYASEFRQIITDYEKMHGHPPTADDLLWIASQHANKDIRQG